MKKGHCTISFWIGIAASALLMTFLFRNLETEQLLAVLKDMNLLLIVLAVFSTFANYFFRAVRWKYLLAPIFSAGLGNLYSSTIIGYMANNILPARLGEIVRAYILARKERVSLTPVLASLVIDRLCDGFMVLLMLLAALWLVHFPSVMLTPIDSIRAGGIVAFLVYTIIIIVLILLKFHTTSLLVILKTALRPMSQSLSEKTVHYVESFISGIPANFSGVHIVGILFTSLLTWFFAVLPIHLVLRSVDITFPFTVSIFIMVLIAFAALLPAAPGSIGTFHYACYKGLTIFYIPEGKALGIALVIHAIGFFPVVLAGLCHLWYSKISFTSIRNISDAA